MGSDLRSQIGKLVQIQDLEGQCRKLQRQLDEIPARIAALEQRTSAFDALVAQAAADLEAVRKEYRSLERENQDNRQKAIRSRERLMSVKTNKEYAAGLKEIEDLEGLNSGLEDRMIERLEAGEAAERFLVDRRREAQSLAVEVQAEKRQLEIDGEALTRELATVSGQCKQQWKQITPEMLAIFRATRTRQPNGNAVASVSDALCHGCQRNIPHQLYNELQRWDTVRYCPHCHRMIYHDKSE